MFKLRLVDEPSNQRIEIDFGSSLAEVACIRAEREVLTIVDMYGSSNVCLEPEIGTRDFR